LFWISGEKNQSLTFFLVSTSIFSLILILYLLIIDSNFAKIVFHNIIVGLTFSIVCIIGGIAAIYPSKCEKILSSKNSKKKDFIHSKKANSRAHHYLCKEYHGHTFQIGNEYFCATCSGLLTGAIFGIIGSVWYFSGFFQIDNIIFLTPAGFIGVSFGLFQSLIPKLNGARSRLLAGISLVLGAYILLINIDRSGGGTFVDLFFIVISIFWIFTKINLSQKEHREICLNCSPKLCLAKEKTKSQ
jgi:hypothetical protein